MNDLRAYFEDLAESWDGRQPPDREEVLRALLASFAPQLGASHSILEVGSGTGALTPCLRERAHGVSLISIDLAGAMLRLAQQHHPDATVIQADAHCLPFVASGFDFVVCHNSFPHFADKLVALHDLARVLQPGGHLLILHDLSRDKVNAVHRNGGTAIQNDLLPPSEEMVQMLVRAGFSAVQAEDSESRFVVLGCRQENEDPY